MHRKPTTSFFDQDHSKSKRQFSRTKTRPHNENSLVPPPPAPSRSTAIAPSASTKKQLDNFRFSKLATPQKTPHKQKADTSPEDDPVVDNNGSEPAPPTPARSSDTGSVLPGSSAPEPVKDVPRTPAPRISLAQLVGYDDSLFLPAATQMNMSPEDRILWKSGTPRPDLERALVLKRAAEDSPSQFNTPAGKKLKDGSALRTPVEDPASQLWKRYSGNESKLRTNNPTARLFQGANRSPSTFRRTHSSPGALGGLSRLKRRRTVAMEGLQEEEDVVGELPQGKAHTVPRAAGRKERVSLLLNEVKRNMNSPLPGFPLSSSPLRGDSEPALPSSPVRPRPAPNRPASTGNSVMIEPPALDSDGDDYGDFEVDMDDLAEIDQIASTALQAVEAPVAPSKLQSQPSAKIQKSFDDEDDDDDYGDDDIFGGGEIESLMASFDAPQASKDKANGIDGGVVEGRRRLQRFRVVEVSKGDYQKAGRFCAQTIIHVRDELSPTAMKVLLRDAWQQTTLPAVGQTVHVIGSFDKTGACIVDNAHHYIIVEPDYLMSATVVADTIRCMRMAVLQERVKATGDISKAMVYGNILHALFQAGLEENDFSSEHLNRHIGRILLMNLVSLYQLRNEIPDLATASEYVTSKIPTLQEWAKRYVMALPNSRSTVTDYRGKSQPLVAINKLLDIEEHVWSPLYGLKGNIDATVQAVVVEGANKKTITVPLELKTGRNSSVVPHRAQTMLYTLLMSDRYDINVGNGLLYYLEQNEMIRVPAIRNELRELILKRNEVASYTINRETLPDMLQDERTCSRCFAKNSCFLYHKLNEGGTPESSGAENAFAELTQHLTPKHAEFFAHWDNLLRLEEQGSIQFRREVWTMNSTAREALGRCFGDVVIVPGSTSVDSNTSKINRYGYSFTKRSGDYKSFYDSQLSKGDPIVISDEKGHYALAIGFITDIQRYEISVQVDRRLHNARSRQKGFEEDTNQVFNGIFELKSSQPGSPKNIDDQVVYRIDKDEYGSGMASVRNNLIQLFSKDTSPKYRRLIVDLEEPVFTDHETTLPSPTQMYLNEDQQKAIEKVITARDYALILGMPGTGKTTTIAHIIRTLVSQGKSVLLTSYTHTAVDNILMKIAKDKFDILRLGSRAKILPEIIGLVRLAEDPQQTFEQLDDLFEKPQIVATTCLGINHPIFTKRIFDYCIVDEASQITLPTCIGPIRYAKTFVLVGDHHQLPPLVKNKAAKEGGLDISLFKMLCEVHPSAVVNLEHQYRMCEEIMTISNELIYSGRLKCGTPEVAKRSLKLPNKDGLAELHEYNSTCSSPCWIEDLLKQDVKVCFVDTDAVPAREERKGDRVNNPTEADMVHQLVEAFLACGISPTSIGVISVYRSQLKLIQHRLRSRSSIEMYTADRFQGRDKEIVIISLVRSNDQNNIGELLKDWRRINVAFTRARSKLIILGSKGTLSANELLRDFVLLVEERGWVYKLPENASLMHQIPELATAVISTPKKKAGEKNNLGPKRSPKRVDGRKRDGLLGTRGVLGNIVNDMW